MGTLYELPHPNILAPFIPDFKKKRTLVRRERVVERTIELKECNDTEDFKRLVQIYQTLEHLKALGSSMTHLQTVEEQGVKKQERLIVELSPVGYHKAPSIDQVGEWLEHMLTGLKHWHSLAYCHGDVSWRNIVFVPTERNGGYWMLIDLDKSHVSNTTVIEWSHRHQGQKLRMEHDLSQLGGLMETLPFTLPANMKSMQEILLTAVDTSGLTANAALTKLGAFLR